MQKVLDEIQAHPLVVALVVFVVIFLGYNAFKKQTSPTGLPGGAGTGTAIAPGTGVGGPTGTELYNSQLYQYPTYQQPVIQNIAPSPNPPPSTVPGVTPPAPASKSIYNGLLSVVGSIHPANIGPWTAGRQVNISGSTYTLDPGPSGRLWGNNKATGQKTLLWNGNDYAGGARQAATIGGAF
jgi:hypothetical protein